MDNGYAGISASGWWSGYTLVTRQPSALSIPPLGNLESPITQQSCLDCGVPEQKPRKHIKKLQKGSNTVSQQFVKKVTTFNP